LDEARELYGVEGASLVFHNYASQGDLPRRRLAKRSGDDGEVHLVYEGGMGGTAHRDFRKLFIALAKRDIHVHIYPTRQDPQLAALLRSYPRIHYNAPLSPKRIMEEMTQFDVGIIPFNLDKGNRRFLDSTIANKLFEYLAAGLPVATSPLRTYVEYFHDHPVGVTFTDADDLIRQLPRLNEIAEQTDFSQQVFTFEGEIGRLEEFYRSLLASAPRCQD